jgi:Ca-activated chloride channel family protein
VSLLAPLALGFLALAIPLVLLYFLKVRRRDRSVSSLLLWHATRREQQTTAVFQRFQRDPLLALQLLALLLLGIALARPVVSGSDSGAQKVVVVLDTSVSMTAGDVAGSRFAAAQQGALDVVRRLGATAEVTVIEAGISPRVTAAPSRDHANAATAVRTARAREFPSRLPDAIRTARALVSQDPGAEIHIFTDGTHPPTDPADRDDPRLRWHGVGRGSDNVGISGFAVRRNSFATAEHQAFLSLVNFSHSEKSFSFKIDLDGRVLATRSVSLAPEVRRSIVLPFSHEGGGLLTARLSVADDLAADNTAHAVIPPPRKIAVLLVTGGNPFLEHELRADPYVAVEIRRPAQYRGGMEGFDVVVVDGVSPPAIGRGRFILVNSAPRDVPIEVLSRMERPVVLDWDRSHPIMRHVDPAKVAIEDALRIRPLAAGKALIDSASGPLIYLVEEPDRKVLFVGFDLFKSDFPLHVAFPLVIANAIRWLHPAGLDYGSFQVAAGHPIQLPVESGVTSAWVRTPHGRRAPARIVHGVLSFPDTDEVGVYTVETERGETRIAVNLADAHESNLTPRPLPAPTATTAPPPAPIAVHREQWALFVLAALLVLLLEGVLYWRRQTGGRIRLPWSTGDRVSLGLRAALVAVLIAALFQPKLPRWVDHINVVFLLDQSDSMTQAARDRAWRFVREATAHMRSGDRVGLVVFGQEPVLAQELAEVRELSRPTVTVAGRETNLFQAIHLGLATLPGGGANRLVLLSDGRQNAGSAIIAARAAREAGTDVFHVPIQPMLDQEVLLESLIAPDEVKIGEPFEARVVAWSEREARGRLSLYHNGDFVGSQVVNLNPGKNVFGYRQSLDKGGVHVFQAGIEVEGDTIAENNRAVATVAARGRPTVLLAEKNSEQAASLATALRSQHIDVTVVPPERIPQDAAGLRRYDGLILSNVSSLKLSRPQMAQIRDYVRDYGGGLIMVGGEESFGVGGYFRTPVEEALPVTMEVKQKLEIPSLAVVLAIDRSGSMAMSTDEKVTKLDLAKEAAHLVVDLLDDRSEIGIMSWDTEFTWDAPVQSTKNRAAVHRAIASIRAGGGTDGYPALREAYRVLFDRPAVVKHVLFLSDGQMTRSDFHGLLSRMAKDKITVSAIAVGSDSDVQLMRELGKWGKGRYYYTEDQQTLPRIFALETQLASKAALIEQPFRPRIVAPEHEVLQEIEWKTSPPLGGYVATTVKTKADLVMMTHQEDPLLATWRYGLGRTAAFTSDAKGKWGVLWLRWSGFGQFWAQLVRWTLRTGTPGDTVTTVKRTDGIGEVTVDAVDPRGDFINFLEAEVGVVTPDRSRLVVDLEQVGPGRYRGRFPAPREGVYLVGVSQRQGGRMLGSQLAGMVVPYAQELRELGADEQLLSEVSEVGGGSVLTAPAQAFVNARRQSRIALPMWPWLVGAALLLLLPDIASRRVGFGFVGGVLRRLGGRQPEREAA